MTQLRLYVEMFQFGAFFVGVIFVGVASAETMLMRPRNTLIPAVGIVAPRDYMYPHAPPPARAAGGLHEPCAGIY